MEESHYSKDNLNEFPSLFAILKDRSRTKGFPNKIDGGGMVNESFYMK